MSDVAGFSRTFARGDRQLGLLDESERGTILHDSNDIDNDHEL
jgi:hypothetical protein